MALKNFDELVAAVGSGDTKRVVVAAAHDEHALEAVLKAHKEGIIDYTLVGRKEDIISISKSLGYDIIEENIVDVYEVQDAAFKAVELIREGKGDFLMKGKLDTSVLLKQVVNKETGIGTGRVMSHMIIMQIPTYHKLLGITDGGMLIAPTLEQKVGILHNSIDFFHRLGIASPKVACLAAVESVNPKMQETVDGAELKKMALNGDFGDCYVEGPISCDLSFSKEVAVIKGFESPVTGDPDILLMPSIAAGNISSKMLICLAGSSLAGCVLGAKVPIVVTSRGSSFEEKYYSLLLCAAQVK